MQLKHIIVKFIVPFYVRHHNKMHTVHIDGYK